MSAAAPGPDRRAVLGGLGALAAAPAPHTHAPAGLGRALDFAMHQASSAVLVRHRGAVVAERYAAGWDADRPREVASVAKSMVAVLIAMAIGDGAIRGFDQPAADFIPVWRADARAGVSLRHLMSMTSGLDDTRLALRGIAGDQFAINAAAPLRDPPGTRWAYNTAAYHLLFHILARAVGERFDAWADRRLLAPLGMTGARWITSPGAGEGGPVVNYYSAAATARDLGRFGDLALGRGVAGDAPLVDAGLLAALLTPSQALNPSYGLLWWLNRLPGYDAFGRGPALRLPSAPRDAVAALGAGGQMVVAVPSREVVIVRQGEAPTSPDFADGLVARVLAAL